MNHLPGLTSLSPLPPPSLPPQVGDHFNYGVFEHQMMLKGLQFVGIDDMGSDKVKKEKIAVSGGWPCRVWARHRGMRRHGVGQGQEGEHRGEC